MTISVNTDAQGYDIILCNGARKNVGELLDLDRKVLIVTDDGVPREYADAVAAQCAEPVLVSIPGGESSKSPQQLLHILSVMLNASFTRQDCVVAVGGGVVGDLSGFAASCYMRGIDFYNIPTTLLSQVDSSIGGKTAVNFEGVKNIIGTFYQPKRVIIDPTTLHTLPARQLHAGLAEAIKMAMTCDAELFSLIERSSDLSADLEVIIDRSLRIKKEVVEKDPRENGLRRVLNFGHTIGHAIEGCRGGELLHGECVALGMLPMCSAQARQRLTGVLQKYRLPTKATQNAGQLLSYLLHDKKTQSDHIATVIVDEIGTFRLREMRPEEILENLEKLQ